MKTVTEDDRRQLLLRVERPGRYTGGEYGSVRTQGILSVALSYPDLYEIGMSNNAVKILYGVLNGIDGVSCERVFAPGRDLEEELTRRALPLFTLESARTLFDFDIMAFSVGYELNATTVLQILHAGNVPLKAADRDDRHPIVIGGGPALVNPAPWLPFFDGIYIGEAEGWIIPVFTDLVRLKQQGAGRETLAERLLAAEAVLSRRKPSAVRAVWTGFGKERTDGGFPVCSVKTAHNHGTVEIMRGCPNGCRFCNAGFIYRPFREKPVSLIREEAFQLVFKQGYREISLSSLSTGDYPGIKQLLLSLNEDFAAFGVSFSLPSLKVDSFALELFQAVTTVRKSGLTFAVESPRPSIQAGVNKIVSFEKTRSLLREARSLGWRQAKFYFMLGLPGCAGTDESAEIVDFLTAISRETGMALSVNLSTFVPKPHTPFQWSAQLPEDESREKIETIRSRLPRRHFKTSSHFPFQSFLEGLISRGDTRTGDLIEKAFRAGARLDAWEDHIDIPLWKRVIAEADWDVRHEVYRQRSFDEKLPWGTVKTRIATAFLKKEAEKALCGELSSPCLADCLSPCGVCDKQLRVRETEPENTDDGFDEKLRAALFEKRKIVERGECRRILFSFSKKKDAVFLSHLNVMTVFEQAFLRAGYFCVMTGGFNPKPVLEFASPLPLGFSSRSEIALVELRSFDTETSFINSLNKALPAGFEVHRARELIPWIIGTKKRSLMGCYWGDDYLIESDCFPEQLNALTSHCEHFSLQGKKQNRLVFRHAKHENRESSLRKLFESLFGTKDYLLYCRPTRIMTLMSSDDRKPVNYLRFFS